MFAKEGYIALRESTPCIEKKDLRKPLLRNNAIITIVN